MLVHRRATPHHLICRYPDVYPCVERSIMRVKCLGPDHGQLDPETSALTMRPPKKQVKKKQEKKQRTKKRRRKEINEWMNEKLKDETIL